MLARRLNMSRRALRDQADTFNDIAEENPVAADAFITDLTDPIGRMAGFGLIGSSHDGASGLRSFVYRQRCISLYVTETELHVLRILRGRRAISASTFTESDTD
ncbi:type II toxin-antitoxin system RelE/ParE family toxin [Rhizobium sp. DKSPLA3]|uniref:Type II toxin-antitoxin system RelE/ParE family toxin n=1 Tax=Rhizobium quercicola TaxID=2901226 RepID=A0A9X1NPS8_9HYPH|nr:type II toxin-antitoxin system RelE/ParE family toxin [Rhizobium quercicola]MCD7108982.1 type II toxin-antitoxin system RelE/ParE family toxin [Rhizobium quercicola]